VLDAQQYTHLIVVVCLMHFFIIPGVVRSIIVFPHAMSSTSSLGLGDVICLHSEFP
jgi:hypothetical protein